MVGRGGNSYSIFLMPILHVNFQDLPFEQQLPMVWAEGTFLARRWAAGHALALYLMAGGFLCEVCLTQEQARGPKVRSFVTTDTEQLEKYLCHIQLNDLPDIDA